MKLPPLNSVRAFEAAARLASFRLAAEELFVTPGAISQQVRTLEDDLGVRLFERLPRAIRLTVAGQEFFSVVSRSLRAISQAAERLKPRNDQVRISVVPTLGSRWLMPRLQSFTAAEPDVQVSIDATPVMADFEHDTFDLGIRYGRGDYPGLDVRLLFTENVVPLCSPGYLDQVRVDGRIDFRRVRLLHEQPDDFWPAWRAEHDESSLDCSTGMYFSHGMLALSAALDGQGLALAPLQFAVPELASGTLVVADPRKYAPGRGYYLVWPRRTLTPAATKFRDWVIRQIEATSQEVRCD